MRYVADAPLANITDDFANGKSVPLLDAPPSRAALAARIDEPDVPPMGHCALADALLNHEASTTPKTRFVVNTASGVLHLIGKKLSWEFIPEGRTACGRPYSGRDFQLTSSFADGASRCNKCANPQTWLTVEAETQPFDTDSD